jgi:hypothetical protein
VLVQLDQSFATIQGLRNLERPVLGGVSMRQSAPRKGQVVSALAFLFGVILLIVVLGGLVVGIHGLPKFV